MALFVRGDYIFGLRFRNRRRGEENGREKKMRRPAGLCEREKTVDGKEREREMPVAFHNNGKLFVHFGNFL